MLIVGMLVIGLVVGFGIGMVVPTETIVPQTTLLEQIQNRGYIIVGTSSDYPPFEIYNTTTEEYEGFDIDLVNGIARQIGVSVQWQDMAFGSLVGACQAGTVDMLAAAMFITPERAEQLAYSLPYIVVNQVVVVKGDSTLTIDELSDLDGQTVGVQTGTTEDDTLTDLNDQDGISIDIVRFARADAMMTDLDSGALDAVFIDEPVFQVYQTIYGLKKILTEPSPPTGFYCRYDSEALLEEIDTYIMTIQSNGTLDTLIEKWFG